MINFERHNVEFESVPEFIREPATPKREGFQHSHSRRDSGRHESLLAKVATVARQKVREQHVFQETEESQLPHPKSAELEALWPGVGHDFLHTTSRGPGFYAAVGFAGGVVATLLVMWLCGVVMHSAVTSADFRNAPKKIVISDSTPQSGARAVVSTRIPTTSDTELVVPIFTTYDVKTGDTLAAIALQAYHRASPRLLDAICKANGLKSADVLNLGQRLVLPEYRPQLN